MGDSTTIQARSAVLRRSFRKDFPAAVRGEGVYLWDADGKKYLDLAGSAAVNFIGHGVARNLRRDGRAGRETRVRPHQPVHHAGRRRVRRRIARVRREKRSFRGGAVYFTCGGSESIETALKLARQYQVEIGQAARHQILSRQQSYHGSTLGALSVSGNRRRREMYLPMVREFAHVGMPYCYRCAFDCSDGCRNCGQQYAAELERAIEATNGEAAAFIFEPVSGATLGAVVPPPGYLQSVAEICRHHGVLLIADEVMTGMGRTGRNFAVDHWNVAPDILVTAKGLSSGYAPLGAVIASKKVVDAIAAGSGAFLHGFTYNAHPISLAAGRAVLRHLQASKVGRSRRLQSPRDCRRALQANPRDACATKDAVGDVRGIGLLWAVEFVADKPSQRPFPADQNFAGRVAAAALEARPARLPHARQRRRHPRRPPSSGSPGRHHPGSDRLVGRAVAGRGARGICFALKALGQEKRGTNPLPH